MSWESFFAYVIHHPEIIISFIVIPLHRWIEGQRQIIRNQQTQLAELGTLAQNQEREITLLKRVVIFLMRNHIDEVDKEEREELLDLIGELHLKKEH